MAVRPRGRSTFQADLQLGGTRHRYTFDNEPDALKWEGEAKAAFVAGLPIPVPGNVSPASKVADKFSLGELRTALLATPHPYGWKGNKSEKTAEINSGAVVRYFGEAKRVTEITAENIRSWTLDLSQAGNSGSTINRKLAALSRMFKGARQQGLKFSPPEIEYWSEGEHRDRVFTEQEEAQIIAVLRTWGMNLEAHFVAFLFDTGCRLGEALKLAPSDVWNERATFRDTKRRKENSTKGEDRPIVLSDRAKAAVAFGTALGQPKVFPVSRRSFRTTWDRLRHHFKWGPREIPHAIRHTWASRMAAKGIPLFKIGEFLGNPTAVRRYSHLTPNEMGDIKAALDAA